MQKSVASAEAENYSASEMAIEIIYLRSRVRTLLANMQLRQ